MSGFEHYSRELAEVDREIRNLAIASGIDLRDRVAVRACLDGHAEGVAANHARETLYGLLQLRLRIETEMLELGITPPEIVPHTQSRDTTR